DALDDWRGAGPGDVLVFLPGEREIRAVADALSDLRAAALSRHASVARDWDVLPLYGRLAQGDQERIFKSTNRRRVVLATNIAETSLTVPGIGYVVDTGLARVKRYRIRGKVEQLQIEPISQAQAAPRAGRAGRVAAGGGIRLFSEADFPGRPAHPDPEIHRSSLAAVLLRMKFLGLLDVEHFAFVDPPSKRAIADGIAQLKELGAIDSKGGLSEIGRQMAELPLDPRLARMLIAARINGCLREMMVIVAALSIQDPRERPLDQQQAADQSHRRFADERSEFKSWLKLWSFTDSAFAEKASNRSLDKSFKAAFLSPLRVREWRDVHRQVHDWVLAQGWKENEREADDLRLHQAILTGLLSNIGVRIDSPSDQGASVSARDRLWQGTHEVKFAIWPGSHLAKKPPRWLMAAEQVETSRLFARTIAAIEPEWVEAEHPLFILYTSGSTGKPKGVQHSTGGYLLHAVLTMKYTFDLRPDDVFWCTADIGWVTGHTYIAYGPLACGGTQIVFEGVP
ncbi:MAG: AMP-binding protein, partial [Burkholderiaceae bacterium]